MPWKPVGRPKRKIARITFQSALRVAVRRSITSRPEKSSQIATSEVSPPARVVPIAAPVTPIAGKGPKPVMKALASRMFEIVRKMPSRIGVLASPAARSAPPIR
jgi:hypothetical protein